jgi:hypothetical protein
VLRTDSPISTMVTKFGTIEGSRKRTKVGVSCAYVTRISLIALAMSLSLVVSSGMQTTLRCRLAYVSSMKRAWVIYLCLST